MLYRQRMPSRTFIVLLAALCALVTAGSQVEYIRGRIGVNYLKEVNSKMHRERVEGTALAPFRYRILSTYIVEGLMQTAALTGIDSLRVTRRGEVVVFSRFEVVSFFYRFVQNGAVFLLAFMFMRGLGFDPRYALFAFVIISYGMSFAYFNTDLSFYTYSEIVFFLIAGILALRGCWKWLPILVAIASFERETAILIPLFVLTLSLDTKEGKWKLPPKNVLAAIFLSVLISAFVFMLLRWLIPPAHYFGSSFGNVYPGFGLLWLNMKYYRTWFGILQMFGPLIVVPFLYKRLQPIFRQQYLLFVIPWFIVHFYGGSASETRLFLVPFIVTFVPAALSLLPSSDR